ncbi:MAG: glyceraldehyde 3-phosphate dehydrogenase NAD-binding domain-containing protein [Candidatus Shapirobacteria bacterium]|nr:glyceraldehyde 3-phosphate dehydrogenase NAD-binding domain-containing protein [Candidatus Shapirobacteria bacterium]MDD4383044.1 glyceraldehyde 3-phosphate dehydrogenase NAD-binding domain-containing protein [Candidatus Shapirobacteria bacterium]
MKENKKIRIAINGFGRIGSVVLRAILAEKYDVEVAAINTDGRFDVETFAMQFKYDSVYGRSPWKVEFSGAQKAMEIGRLGVGENSIPVLGQMDPTKIPWKNYDVDVVLECTGAFTDSKALAHIKAGAKKVVISAPTKDKTIPTYILGVNGDKYKGEKLISNGSCTTNCVAPIVKLIDEKIGFQEGTLTTIHAYTTNQNLVDGNSKDPRRARAAAINIVPTTTGAAEAVIACYPEAKGRFGGTAIRVPVVCGSYSDLTFKLVRKTTIEEINSIFEEASVDPELVGKLKVSYEPLVSSDILGNNASCVIDTEMTKVVSDDMISIGAWYDNEYGYSCRLIENAIAIGQK